MVRTAAADPSARRRRSSIAVLVAVAAIAPPLWATRAAAVTEGERAQGGEAPWHVQIQYTVGPNTYHHCGGSLIRPNWVLTAWHCVMEWDGTRWVRLAGDTLQVRSGLVDRRDGNAQVLGVAEVFEYEPFMPDQKTDTAITPATNDIALIHLATSADLSDDWVNTINMAEADADMSGKVTLTGWGADTVVSEQEAADRFAAKVGPSKVQHLRIAELEVMDNEACSDELYDQMKVGHPDVARPNIPTGAACVADYNGIGQAFCSGDSGGGVVNEDLDLVGVVSWTYTCNDGPGVVMDVARYRAWIDQTISDHSD